MTSPLRESRDHDEAGIAEFASESIVILDESGKVRSWNPAAERIFGWPALALRGTRIADISPSPADERRAWAHLLQEGSWHGRISRYTRDGGIVCAEVRRHLRYDGTGMHCDVIEFAYPTRDSGETQYAAGPVPDRTTAASWQIDVSPAAEIIAQIAARAGSVPEDELRDIYSRLVERALIVEVNERTARLVGGNRGPALLAGQSVAAFWPVGSRGILAELVLEALRGREGKVCRRQLASDGILRDPLVTVWRAGRAHSGRLFIAVNGAADDDRSYLFLRASEARYRKLIDYMPVALWQVDASHMGKIYAQLRADGVVDFERYLEEHPELVELAAATVNVTDVNRRAIELVGGAGVQDLIRPVGYLFAANPAALRRVMIGRFTGRKNYSELMKLQTLDNRVLDVRFSVTYPEPLLELDTTIFSLEDVTEQLRMETQLRQLQADFSHAARVSMLGELASSIAHEVNQPLAAIVTNAETSLRWLGRDKPDIGKVEQLTARIVASARRADEIVQRVRGMAVKQAPAPVELAFNEIIQESLLFVRHEIETRSVRVRTSYARGLPPVIGDRIQLQQVVVNMLINAIQAVEGCDEALQEIALSTGTDEKGDLLFMLGDRGPGIAPDHIARIFDGFFTTKTHGMGIGLAICQSIVTAHGGELSASNRPGGGAQFRVILPRAGRFAAADQIAGRPACAEGI
ncbi:ATP-binding protein [Sphingomonas fennica]|uniref:histidine kinase n=1 Tax=Edaphosphingomonas fennica TaxID=114404 RepID=A0A2T4HT22_9SPHN|nr:ATP-binding protein [Sphingomonas fennica]PTD18959.1 PAS domain-containing sensor histidine kinase [Sphingomonas fennica]